MDYLIIIFLILGSGFFSGLTIGLMSLDSEVLKTITKIGGKGDSSYTEREAIYAKKVLDTTQDKTTLLVTLLLGNTAVNATLSIFMSSVVGEGLLAGAVSTLLIVVFGEIIPALFLTKYALYVGAMVSPLVKLLILTFKPLTYYFVKLLNFFLKQEELKKVSRTEMIHKMNVLAEDPTSDIDKLDVNIVSGALSLKHIKLEELMTPRNEVFRLDINTILTESVLEKICESGYTRIPIFDDIEQENFVGIFNVKKLIGKNVLGKSVAEFTSTKKIIFSSEMFSDDAIIEFINSKNHIAIVSNGNYWEGIVTLEDILEHILDNDIIDEFDKN